MVRLWAGYIYVYTYICTYSFGLRVSHVITICEFKMMMPQIEHRLYTITNIPEESYVHSPQTIRQLTSSIHIVGDYTKLQAGPLCSLLRVPQ